MSPQCLPPWRLSWMSEWNEFSSFESPCLHIASHQVSAQSDLTFGRRCRGQLEYWNGTHLAILITSMPPTKFRLNPTYCSGADMIWRFSRWPLWQPSWIWEQNNFSHSESLCCSNAYHQVSAQSDLQFRRRCRLKNFKMVAILDIGMEWF